MFKNHVLATLGDGGFKHHYVRTPFPAAVASYLLCRSQSSEVLELHAAAAGRLAGKLLTGMRSAGAAQELFACWLF